MENKMKTFKQFLKESYTQIKENISELKLKTT